jgi:hypothetical protein
MHPAARLCALRVAPLENEIVTAAMAFPPRTDGLDESENMVRCGADYYVHVFSIIFRVFVFVLNARAFE